MSNPNPNFDPENVKEEDNEASVCDICQGERKVEVIANYQDENGYDHLEGTGKFIPCPECNESYNENDQDK